MNQYGNPHIQNSQNQFSNNLYMLGMNTNTFGNNNNQFRENQNFNHPQKLTYSYNDIFNDTSTLNNLYVNENNNFGNSYMNSNYHYSQNFSGDDNPELIKKIGEKKY